MYGETDEIYKKPEDLIAARIWTICSPDTMNIPYLRQPVIVSKGKIR
jgi:hypothetical protein